MSVAEFAKTITALIVRHDKKKKNFINTSRMAHAKQKSDV
jgi:hypothetical protein